MKIYSVLLVSALRKVGAVLLVAGLLWTSACENGSDGPGHPSSPLIVAPKEADVVRASWLAQRLPAGTLAYVRIPRLVDWFTAPKGDLLHWVQSNEYHQQTVGQFDALFSEQLAAIVPEPFRALFMLLYGQAVAPVEIAVLPARDGSPIPNILAGIDLGDMTADQLNALLETLGNSGAMVTTMSPLDDKGKGILMAGPMAVYAQFEHSGNGSGKLWLLSGTSATAAALSDLVQAQPGMVPAQVFEQTVDAAGQGLAMWVDLKAVWALAGTMADVATQKLMGESGLDKAEFVWLGSTSQSGRAGLLLHLQMPDAGFKRFVPNGVAMPAVGVAGPVEWVMAFNGYEPEHARQWIDLVREIASAGQGAKDMSAFEGFITEMTRFLGPLGQGMWFFEDQAGSFWVVPVKDPAAFAALVKALEQVENSTLETQSMGALSIGHWSFSNQFLGAESGLTQLPGVGIYLERLRSHIYWVEEGGYLIVSDTPQALLARSQSLLGTLDQYASDLYLSRNDLLLGFAGRGHNRPERIYGIYLRAVQFLGDMLGQPVDLFKMPDFGQAKLPEDSPYGLSIYANKTGLGLELDYGYSALEGLGASPMVGIAVVGVLAAIAIPAYSDYTTRAQVGEAWVLTEGVKTLVAEHFHSKGAMPNDNAAIGITEVISSNSVENVSVRAGGCIDVTFDPNGGSVLGGQVMTIRPILAADGTLSWACGVGSPNATDGEFCDDQTTVGHNYLPASCR